MVNQADYQYSIDARELERMLLDPNVSDEALRPYLIESQQDSDPFRPAVEVNPDRVTMSSTEAAVALNSLNGLSRWRRHSRYRHKVKSWTGLRIVSEGDSWFQYPFLLDDVIDWLSKPYAVFSLDAAGDLIADMVRQGELITAVLAEQPNVVLLSGGGNDLLGGANLAKAVLPFKSGRAPEAYLDTGFDANLAAVLAGYRTLFARLTQVAPNTPVLCHVYDHVVPNNGRWLGRPLTLVGITDPLLQRAIVSRIIDRFHSALADLAQSFPQVRLVDTRGTVGGRWHDELHPTNAGYAAVAQLFAEAIAVATNTPRVEIQVDAGTESTSLEGGLGLFSDDALLSELGRRRRLRTAGDIGANEPLLIFPSSVGGEYPALRSAGVEAVAAARDSGLEYEANAVERQLIGTLFARSGAVRPAAVGRRRQAPSHSADRLLARLAMPADQGAMEAAVEGATDLNRRERLSEAKRVLKQLAAGVRDVDEALIDQLIQDADEALRKLAGDGPDATLHDNEVFGLEAVIETDGSRPVLFVQDGNIDLTASELHGALAERWLGAAATFRDGIGRVASAVGAIQLPAFDKRRVGTAFAIAPGLVLTNRHVLEEIAIFDGQRWRWQYGAEIDFGGEYDRDAELRFPLVDVVAFGPNPINRTVNFANVDFAVLRVGEGTSAFPQELSFEAAAEKMHVGAAEQPPIYLMGFPAKPWLARGAPENGPPRVGHEYEEVLERLFADRFDSKRWAPGLVRAGAGQLATDEKKWVMSHDASTLAGNSGSCVVEFHDNGERVVGLHFGGRPRIENYAHVLAKLQKELAGIDKIRWI